MSLECNHRSYFLDDADDIYRCKFCYEVVDPDEADWIREDGDDPEDRG